MKSAEAGRITAVPSTPDPSVRVSIDPGDAILHDHDATEVLCTFAGQNGRDRELLIALDVIGLDEAPVVVFTSRSFGQVLAVSRCWR